MEAICEEEEKLERKLLSACNVEDLSEVLCLTDSSISPLSLLRSPSVLAKLVSLRQVDFSGFVLRLPSGEAADKLLRNLGLLKNLRILRLSRCSLSTARFLSVLPQLHVADLSRNTIFDLGDLVDDIGGGNLSLQSLDLSFNTLPDLSALRLVELSRALSHLTNLNFRGCPLVSLSAGAASLARTLAPHFASLEMCTGVEVERRDVSPTSETSTFFSFSPNPKETDLRDRRFKHAPPPQVSICEATIAESESRQRTVSISSASPQEAAAEDEEEEEEEEEAIPTFGASSSSANDHHHYHHQGPPSSSTIEEPAVNFSERVLRSYSESLPKALSAFPQATSLLPETSLSESPLSVPPESPAFRPSESPRGSIVRLPHHSSAKAALTKWKASALEEIIVKPDHAPMPKSDHSLNTSQSPAASALVKSEHCSVASQHRASNEFNSASANNHHQPKFSSASSANRIRLPRETQCVTDPHFLNTPVTPNLSQPQTEPAPPSFRDGYISALRKNSEVQTRVHRALDENASTETRANRNAWEASPKSCSTRESETSGMLEGVPGTLKNISLPEEDATTKVKPRLRTLRDQPDMHTLSSSEIAPVISPPISLIGVQLSPESLRRTEAILEEDPSVRWGRGSVGSSRSQTPAMPANDLHTYWRSLSNLLNWAISNRTELETETLVLQQTTEANQAQLVDLMLKFRKMSAAYKACMRRLGALTTVLDGSVFTQLAAALVERSEGQLSVLFHDNSFDGESSSQFIPGGSLNPQDLSSVSNMTFLLEKYLAKSPDSFTLLISSQIYAEFGSIESEPIGVVATVESEAIKHLPPTARMNELRMLQSLAALEVEAFSILSSEMALNPHTHPEETHTTTTTTTTTVPTAPELRDLATRLQSSHSIALKRLLKVYLQFSESRMALNDTADLCQTVEDRILETSNKLMGILNEYPEFIPPSSPFHFQEF